MSIYFNEQRMCEHFECKYDMAEKKLDQANFTETWGYSDRDPYVQQAALVWRPGTMVVCTRPAEKVPQHD